MSHTLYDRAVVEKIKSWVIDPEVTVLSPDETRRLLEIYADKKGDAPLKLPLIVISRARDATIRLTANRTMTRGGLVFNSENGMSDHLNAVPITLNYIINIYTRTMEEADEYVRNFVFNIINYPKILISIPYNNANKLYASYMTLQDTVTDNSGDSIQATTSGSVNTSKTGTYTITYLATDNSKNDTALILTVKVV